MSIRAWKSMWNVIVAVVLLFDCAATAQGQRAGGLTESRYAEAVVASRETVHAMMKRGGVPGIGVAVVADGEVVWAEGFGLADLEKQVRVTRETKFAVGSISKSLTTALFAHLVDDGLADWGAPVENYLPEFPHKNQRISVRLIAGHASGLGDQFDTANFYTTKHYASTTEALREIITEPLRSPLRARHFYTTGSYTIIAGVIERVARRDFPTAMNDLVLKPLHLKNTVLNIRHSIIPNRTSFYVQDVSGATINAPYFDPSFKLAGAGYLSTAEDLARFGAALQRPGFLKRATLDELFRPLETTVDGKTEFGLGWRVGKDGKGRRIFHQPGGGAGISCRLFLYPDENVAIAILTNLTGAPVGGRTSDSIADAFISAKSSAGQVYGR